MKRARTAGPLESPDTPEPHRSLDDTFATSLVGIERLRLMNERDRGESAADYDWREWKRSVVASIKAGAELEKQMNWVIPELKLRAKQRVLESLVVRIAALEAEREAASSARARMLGAGGKVLLVILGALASRLWK